MKGLKCGLVVGVCEDCKVISGLSALCWDIYNYSEDVSSLVFAGDCEFGS